MKVIALDLFGTVFDLSQTPREEIVAYIDHVSEPVWKPLYLPRSWESLPPFPDSREGVERLRKRFTVVTCSNAPLGFTTRLLKNADIRFDAITPLEMDQRYKPSDVSYFGVAVRQDVKRSDVLMVTGNERLGRLPYGDHHYAAELGMQGRLIRHPGCPQTIIDLAEQLGC